MRIRHAARSDVGRKRDNNEDFFLVAAAHRLFAAFDGMGGHAAGEVASALAAEVIEGFFNLTAEDETAPWPFETDDQLGYDENRLITALRLANARIVEAATSDAGRKRMGTTVVAAQFVEGEEGPLALVAHVGDSRAYLLREGKLRRLTTDHSLVEEWVRRGKITFEQSKAYAHKNAIIRALGMEQDVQVELHAHEPAAGDVFLLCSDGLPGMVTRAAMEAILVSASTLTEGAEELVQAANDNGGKDNVTVVLAQFL